MPINLTMNGRSIDLRPEAFAYLRDSSAQIEEPETLQLRLREEGYLFIRNLVDPHVLAEIRRLVVSALRVRNLVDPAANDAAQLHARPGADFHGVFEELGQHEATLRIAGMDPLLQLFSNLFGEQAKALDFVWVRASAPGRGEPVHSDWVYMSKGSERLMSTWIPIVDVPIEHGPLMILERSHQDNRFTRKYLAKDADRLGFLDGLRLKHGGLVRGGRYSRRADRVQREFGTRWLTTDFKVGDALVFDPRCLHGTLANQTPAFRLSVDTRFQPAADPMDPRFSGMKPPLHSGRDKSVFDYLTRLRKLTSAFASGAGESSGWRKARRSY